MRNQYQMGPNKNDCEPCLSYRLQIVVISALHPQRQNYGREGKLLSEVLPQVLETFFWAAFCSLEGSLTG